MNRSAANTVSRFLFGQIICVDAGKQTEDMTNIEWLRAICAGMAVGLFE